MPAISSSYEQKLSTEMRTGSRQVFNELYHAYSPLLLGYISKITNDKHASEEALQKSFIEIWRNKDNFDPESERLFTWMLKITKKITVGFIPANRFLTNHKILNTLKSLEEPIETADLREKVLELMHYNNYSLPEVSGILKVEEDKIRVILRTAINKLKSNAE